MEWLKNNTHLKGWSCLHDKDSNQQSETKTRALEILSEDFVLSEETSDYTLLSCAIIYLGSVDIGGDQWFGVMCKKLIDYRDRDKGTVTAYIECDDIIDGVLELVRWDAGDYDHLKKCLTCSHTIGEHRNDDDAFCKAEECECTGLHLDVGDCTEECHNSH